MEQILDKSNFQITLQSDDEDNLSEYWQGQCWYLYDELSRALPEGSIKPLILESSKGERADIITLFHAIIIEITAKIFVETVFEAIKNWYYYRPEANIEIKCPDGSTIKITNQSIPALQKYFDENPHLSICEAVSLFNNSAE
jgi:hypothetical protein